MIAGSVAFMVAVMLLVRARFAPSGGHFTNHDRAAAAFAFVGGGFAILLGFVVLLSFQHDPLAAPCDARGLPRRA